MLIIWVFLFFSAMIVVEGGRIQSRESGDYALIFILFLPLFSLIFSFLEFDYRPDWYDLMALIGLMAGSVFLHAGNQNKTKADESGRPDEQGVANGS
jgi:drug/metabolite transporter (DMT)-like permease